MVNAVSNGGRVDVSASGDCGDAASVGGTAAHDSAAEVMLLV